MGDWNFFLGRPFGGSTIMAGVGRYTIKKRWVSLFWLALVSMILIAIASLAMSIYRYGNSSPKIVQADAAIVLGAAACGEQPFPVFRERINLYKSRTYFYIVYKFLGI